MADTDSDLRIQGCQYRCIMNHALIGKEARLGLKRHRTRTTTDEIVTMTQYLEYVTNKRADMSG